MGALTRAHLGGCPHTLPQRVPRPVAERAFLSSSASCSERLNYARPWAWLARGLYTVCSAFACQRSCWCNPTRRLWLRGSAPRFRLAADQCVELTCAINGIPLER